MKEYNLNELKEVKMEGLFNDFIKVYKQNLTGICGLSNSGKSLLLGHLALRLIKKGIKLIYFDLEPPRFKRNILSTQIDKEEMKYIKVMENDPNSNLINWTHNNLLKMIKEEQPEVLILDGVDSAFPGHHRIRCKKIKVLLQLLKSISISQNIGIVFSVHALESHGEFNRVSYSKLKAVGGEAVPSFSDNLYMINFGKRKNRILEDLKFDCAIQFEIDTKGGIKEK